MHIRARAADAEQRGSEQNATRGRRTIVHPSSSRESAQQRSGAIADTDYSVRVIPLPLGGATRHCRAAGISRSRRKRSLDCSWSWWLSRHLHHRQPVVGTSAHATTARSGRMKDRPGVHSSTRLVHSETPPSTRASQQSRRASRHGGRRRGSIRGGTVDCVWTRVALPGCTLSISHPSIHPPMHALQKPQLQQARSARPRTPSLIKPTLGQTTPCSSCQPKRLPSNPGGFWSTLVALHSASLAARSTTL